MVILFSYLTSRADDYTSISLFIPLQKNTFPIIDVINHLFHLIYKGTIIHLIVKTGRQCQVFLAFIKTETASSRSLAEKVGCHQILKRFRLNWSRQRTDDGKEADLVIMGKGFDFERFYLDDITGFPCPLFFTVGDFENTLHLAEDRSEER